MNSRDKALLIIGVIIGLSGVVLTFAWSVEVGIVTLLAMNLLLLLLLILQRRQLARVQQRTLSLLKFRESEIPARDVGRVDVSGLQRDLKISNKKILGVLQAQQNNLDLLNEKIERLNESGSTN